MRSLLPTCLFVFIALSAAAAPLGDEWGTAERENEFYRITEIQVPEPHFIEAGSFETLPDGRIALGTRRGDIFIVDGLSDPYPKPVFHKFAAGLDELLGLSYRDGAFLATRSGRNGNQHVSGLIQGHRKILSLGPLMEPF